MQTNKQQKGVDNQTKKNKADIQRKGKGSESKRHGGVEKGKLKNRERQGGRQRV